VLEGSLALVSVKETKATFTDKRMGELVGLAMIPSFFVVSVAAGWIISGRSNQVAF
jgi:hypothetical protein